jgi:hypothetical protein
MAKKKDYEVGYKKPPKDTRFKKGQSGNPAGRSKGKDKLTEPGEVFADVMAGLIPVNDNGKAGNISLMRAFFLSEIKKALKGDNAAAKRVQSMLFNLRTRDESNPHTAADEGQEQEVTRDLDKLLDEIAARPGPADGPEEPRDNSAERSEDGPADAKPHSGLSKNKD